MALDSSELPLGGILGALGCQLQHVHGRFAGQAVQDIGCINTSNLEPATALDTSPPKRKEEQKKE